MKHTAFCALLLLVAAYALAREPIPSGFGGLALGDAMPAAMREDFKKLCAANTRDRPVDMSESIEIVAYSRKDRQTRGTPFNTKESDFDDFTMLVEDLGQMVGRDISQVAYFFENGRLSRVRILLSVTGTFEKQNLAKRIIETYGKSNVVCEDNSSNRALYLWRRGNTVFSARYDADNFAVNTYSLDFLSNTPYYQIMAHTCDDPL